MSQEIAIQIYNELARSNVNFADFLDSTGAQTHINPWIPDRQGLKLASDGLRAFADTIQGV